jgi:pimeloyl-ACP methyl ester carboxylesterase
MRAFVGITLLHFAHTACAELLTSCRVPGIAHSVQCGVVQRALDPAKPDGIKIAVHYVVIPAMARRKLPDPVFLLAGGPGQSAISLAPQVGALFSRLNNRRDLVFVDQRGTGQSAPLMCPESKHQALADRTTQAQQLKQLMQCKAELLKRPYIKTENDLSFFTTTLAMQDLDAVRQQLGVERVNLVGVSYGTRAGLEYMRQFPRAVRSSVLDAVAPPDMVLPESFSTDGQAALSALFMACRLEPTCAFAYPHLGADWAALLQSLPKQVQAAHPLTGQRENFTFTREILLGTVRGTLYAPSVAAALPAAINQAAAGQYEGIVGLSATLGSRRGAQLATGMHFSVVCAEDFPLMSRQASGQASDQLTAINPPGADFGVDAAQLYRSACAEWPRGAVPAVFYQVPPSVTPTLLFSGGLDPATPSRHAARVAQALGSSAQHVVVPNGGHGVLAMGCARDLIHKFIDQAHDDQARKSGRTYPIDARCLQRVPRPGVFQPIAAQPAADGVMP